MYKGLSINNTPTENLHIALFNRLPDRDMNLNNLPKLDNILSRLTRTERTVLRLRLGLDKERVSAVTCAKEIGSTPAKVRHIEETAYRNLSHPVLLNQIKALYD